MERWATLQLVIFVTIITLAYSMDNTRVSVIFNKEKVCATESIQSTAPSRTSCAMKCVNAGDGCRAFGLTPQPGGEGFVCDLGTEKTVLYITEQVTDKTYYGALIKDTGAQLTASSSSDFNGNHGPECSVLGVPKPSVCSSEAWAVGDGTIPGTQWIQAEFAATLTVVAVATQGRADFHQYVITYLLAAYDGIDASFYNRGLAEGVKVIQVFDGNFDQTTKVTHTLCPPLVASIIRLYPVSCYNDCSLRWELYSFDSV